MPAFKAYAHRIPKLGRVTAFVSFEPGAVLNGAHALPFLLRSLSRSEKGIINVYSKKTKHAVHPESRENIMLPTADDVFFQAFSKVYGTQYRYIQTKEEIFQHISATPNKEK